MLWMSEQDMWMFYQIFKVFLTGTRTHRNTHAVIICSSSVIKYLFHSWYLCLFILSSSELRSEAYGNCQRSSTMINKVAQTRVVCRKEVVRELRWPCLADSYPREEVAQCETLPKGAVVMWQMKSGMFSVNTIWNHFQVFSCSHRGIRMLSLSSDSLQ